MILAGWSAYPRFLDFERFRAIADEVGAYLMVDMAHFAGLVAAGLHPSPVPYADVVTTTIHKTIGGPRGGMILCTRGVREEDRLGRVPRPAGRPARARDRRQGGGAADRRQSEAFRERQRADARRRPGRGGRAAGRGRRRQRADRRDRRPPRAVRPARVRAGRPAGRGPARRPSGSPSTATRCRSTRGRRRSPPGCGSGRRRWRPAGCRSTTSSRSAGSSRALRCSRRATSTPRRAELAERAAAIADRYPLYAGLRDRSRHRRSRPRPSRSARALAQSPRIRGARDGVAVPPRPAAILRRRHALLGRRLCLPRRDGRRVAADAARGALAGGSGRWRSRASAGWRQRETPLLGGLAILAGVLVAAAIWLPDQIMPRSTSRTDGRAPGGTVDTWAVIAGACVITLVGAIDDMRRPAGRWSSCSGRSPRR